MAMFEQAMSMWTSFGAAAQSRKPGESGEPAPREERGGTSSEELTELKQQLADMQQKIERLARDRS
jgi:polyhydroxyalkanoate synthesis regulator protein